MTLFLWIVVIPAVVAVAGMFAVAEIIIRRRRREARRHG